MFYGCSHLDLGQFLRFDLNFNSIYLFWAHYIRHRVSKFYKTFLKLQNIKMRTFALAALAAFTSAQSLDDLPFDPTDQELLNELGISVDISKCEGFDPANSSTFGPCFNEIERAIKSVDVDGLLEEQWAELKKTDEYEEAEEVVDSLPFYSASQADADVKELAGIIDAQVKGSKLIDAGLW